MQIFFQSLTSMIRAPNLPRGSKELTAPLKQLLSRKFILDNFLGVVKQLQGQSEGRYGAEFKISVMGRAVMYLSLKLDVQHCAESSCPSTKGHLHSMIGWSFCCAKNVSNEKTMCLFRKRIFLKSFVYRSWVTPSFVCAAPTWEDTKLGDQPPLPVEACRQGWQCHGTRPFATSSAYWFPGASTRARCCAPATQGVDSWFSR